MAQAHLNPTRRFVLPPDAPSRTLAWMRPVALAGVANLLLFCAVDRAQPWTILSAVLAMTLLGIVLAQQLLRVATLKQELEASQLRLTAISDVVAALNSSTHLGSTLGVGLERLQAVLGAEAAAVWLRGEAGEDFRLVEGRGIPEEGPHGSILLGKSAEALASAGSPVARFPVLDESGERREALTISLGWAEDSVGVLTVLRTGEGFSDLEAAVLTAIGCDISGALRSVRLLGDARKLADKDPITGLLNHRSAYQRLHTEWQRLRTLDRPLSLIKIDLDHFKLFNTTHGHPAGDELLRRVASVLQRLVREEDVLARYGSDEFLVLLPNASSRVALRCAERIQAALARERFRAGTSTRLPISASIGIAVGPEDGEDVTALMEVVDANLSQSKAQGGGKVTASGRQAVEHGLVYVKGFDLFHAMLQAIDNKDNYTRRHSEEVTMLSLLIGRTLELGPDQLQTLELSAMLHDVGKIGVADEILRKPGKLTEDEYEAMKQHPVFGALIVGAMPGMEEVVLGVRHHHERFDGTGYPDGLAAEQIPLLGRIMAVADAYSAMTTTRPYRKGLTPGQALEEIRRHLGRQFDPEIGLAFIRAMEVDLTRPPTTNPTRLRRAPEESNPETDREPVAV